MKTLLVMRHAKSDWDADYGADHERPLNGRGRRSAEHMGKELAARGLIPEHVMTSSAVRARTTAELAMAAGGWGSTLVVHDELYDSGVGGVLGVIRSAPDASPLMVVGHQPTWSMLVRDLTGMDATMKTAAVAVIQCDVEHWSDLETGTLLEEISPRDGVEPDAGATFVPEGEWVVTSISVGGELVPPLEGTQLTLDVSGDRVSGTAGVNRFMGQVSASGLGPLATTMMAGPPEHMEQERRYLGFLSSAESLEADGMGIDLVESGLITVTLTSRTTDHGT